MFIWRYTETTDFNILPNFEKVLRLRQVFLQLIRRAQAVSQQPFLRLECLVPLHHLLRLPFLLRYLVRSFPRHSRTAIWPMRYVRAALSRLVHQPRFKSSSPTPIETVIRSLQYTDLLATTSFPRLSCQAAMFRTRSTTMATARPSLLSPPALMAKVAAGLT